jgi:4-aminobutyrate aminotransferase-like enzyme
MTIRPQVRSFAIPPAAALLAEGLRDVVTHHYGHFRGWSALGGEDDLNVKVTRDRDDLFLKVSWADDPAFAQFQTELIDSLAHHTPALPVPIIVAARNGARAVITEQLADRPVHLRMTTFLPGMSARGTSLDHVALHCVGDVLARLDEALSHVDLDLPVRATNWDILRAGELLTDVIPDLAPAGGEVRTWAMVLERFVVTTLPQLEALPTQLIHNDLNGSNLLLDAATGQVTGLLDFGDVVVAPSVVDLAVAAAYLVDDSSEDNLIGSLSALVAGYRSRTPLSPDEVALVPEIMMARHAMALALNHARAATSDNPDYIRYVLRNADSSRAKLAVLLGRHTASRPSGTFGQMANAFDPTSVDQLAPAARSIVRRRRRVLGPAYRLQYARPAEFVRGEGVWLVDSDGRRVLDAYNNVPSVGHCHPHVVDAVTRQAATLNTNTRYLDAKILDYAERLLSTHDGVLDNAMFTCSGSEAIDLALRVSRYHTGAEGVIVSRHAYHGVTTAAAAISPALGRFVPLGRATRTVELPFVLPEDVAPAWFERQVEAAIADLEREGIRLAALVTDTIFASDGLLAEPPGFLAEGVDAVRRAGGLFIADEVQPGFGRTGDCMWGYQRHGLRPDIAVMGKPMGNGMPIAGIAARSGVLDRFGRETRYFNTFGGNSVSIAAAAATLDVIEREDLLARAVAVGTRLRSRIEAAVAGRPEFGQIRGAGMYLAVDLRGDDRRSPTEMTADFVNCMRERDVLISATGEFGQALKIRPPLVFSNDDVETFMGAFSAAMSDIA